MMELPPLANLMPAIFEGNPSVLPIDFSSEEFNVLLLNQIVHMEEGICKEDGGQGATPVSLPEESLSPPSDEKDSFVFNSIPALIDETLIHPLSVPIAIEGHGFPLPPQPPLETPLFIPGPIGFPKAVGADIQGEHSLFSEKPGEDRGQPPFVPQRLEEESIGRSSFETKSKEASSHLSLLEIEKDAVETAQGLIKRENSRHEDLSSIFRTKGKEAEHFPGTGKTEGNGQRVLTSSNSIPVTSEKGGPDLTLKFDCIDEPLLIGSGSNSENESRRLASLKNQSSLFESYSIQNAVGAASKAKPLMPEEGQKALNGSPPKVESSEIYRQVGRTIAWSIQNGEEKIKLTLDPPRLGNLYMEVTKEKEIVRATLWAESPLTKELLEAHRTELRRILEEDGFKLERFDVFVQQETDRFMERKEHSFFRGQREVSEFDGDRAFLSSEPSDVSSVAVRRYPWASSYIDRIV